MKSKVKIKNTALLVIDIINSCSHLDCEIPKWGISFSKIRKMIPKLQEFIKKYKTMGGQVVYINCVPWKKEFLAKNIVELYKDPRCKYYTDDDTGFSEKFFFEIDPNDPVFTKNSYDAFTNDKLNQFLKKKNIQHLLVSGIFSDGCVDSTIKGGFSKGYNFFILKDLVETTDVKIRQGLQKLLKEFTWPIMFGKTIESKKISSFIE